VIIKAPEYKILTDNAVLIEFEQIISPHILTQVMTMENSICNAQIYGVMETVPAYASLAVFYNPVVWGCEELIAELKKITHQKGKIEKPKPRLWEVPVCYEKEFAPDLSVVVNHSGLSAEEVIEIHSQGAYLVYMLGFLPGFIYLGGMDERLSIPRKEIPDLKTQAGSIAIGGAQTGIYSLESPAGWNIIGQTPQSFYDPKSDPPFKIKQGDKIKFTPITKQQFITRSK
jgi:inhibitor of KinA